ncbi:hypothetical protein MKX03_010392 [Papaver bracteatum]|nr:hypothetical protein MKX03_010392 [Papaver bracteatum]
MERISADPVMQAELRFVRPCQLHTSNISERRENHNIQGHYKRNLTTFRCSTALYIGVFGRTTPAFRKIKERIQSAGSNNQ